jgi:hypothetical protein
MWAEALSTHPFLAPVDTVLSEACRRKRSQIRLPRSHAEWGNNGRDGRHGDGPQSTDNDRAM